MHAIPWYIALLISVPQTLLIIEFGFRLFNIQLKIKDIILLSVVMAVFCYFSRELSIPYAVNTLLLIALLSLCSAFICRIDLRYCFIAVVLGVMIYGVLESLLLPLMLKFLALSFDEISVSPLFTIIAFVPILIFAMLLLGYIIKKDFVLYDFGNEKMQHNNWWAIATILIEILCLLLINASVIASDNLSSLKNAIPYMNLGLVVMCVFNLITIRNIEKSAGYQTNNRLLKNHLNQVESILKNTEIQQHEYGRHMQTVQSLIELNKIEKAQEYINGITNEYWSNNMIYYIDHPAISALINSKNNVAQVNNIDFAVAIKCDLSGIYMPAWDLCSVLGNLLDNAIEAAANDQKPRVGVEFKYEDGFYAIYINNNGSRINQPDRVFEAGYTTKGSEGRGYGLYIVNKLVHKYHGEIEIINKPKTTIILKLLREGDQYDRFNSLKHG